jgi:2-oxoglutarate ferredoxin oxidoreductase subunit alpha
LFRAIALPNRERRFSSPPRRSHAQCPARRPAGAGSRKDIRTDMSTTEKTDAKPRRVERLDEVIIRFAGDSGDGMQVTGNQFTATSAVVGNDIASFPDVPAEIRAPAGTLPGVSGFQVHFASKDIFTPGDAPDVLVAMNPAALKVNLGDLKRNGTIIINKDSFGPKDLEKAGYKTNPLEDGSLEGFRVISLDLTRLTKTALESTGLSSREMERCKNFFSLGIMYWLYGRPLEPTLRFIEEQFKKNPKYVEANTLALKAGYTFGEATEVFQITYEVPPAALPPGEYRNISGNSALALGAIVAARKAGLQLYLGSYPITPASDILHEMSRYANFGVCAVQAEDEIAAVTSSLGAAFAGALAMTTTSGPGVALKTEAIGLATMVELPLVIANIQRGGPSTGLPTKTEQADLFQALFGRNSEAPVPVIAARTSGDCFYAMYEAARIALKYMTPVILLSDGYLANGSEPWLIPDLTTLPAMVTRNRTDPEGFQPYLRDAATYARPWAIPGTPGLQHRIGGLEKEDGSGNVSYEPLNHEKMVRIRAQKVASVVQDVPDVQVAGRESGDLLFVGWGSTHGAITAATRRLHAEGASVGHAHLRWLNPLPKNLGAVLKRWKRVVVPEMNMGQLAFVLRGKFLVDALSLSKVQGRPFTESEIVEKAHEVLGEIR